MQSIFDAMNQGTITGNIPARNAEALSWNPHPVFEGVRLKHLVTGADTDGAFSVHLVQIDAGCTIETHTHDDSWELHEVAAGSGICELDDEALAYGPGTIAVVPKGSEHKVKADSNGLKLLAKFIPALV